MSPLPPGALFLLRGLAPIAGFSVFVAYTANSLEQSFQITISTWIRIAVIVLVLALTCASFITLEQQRVSRAAARLGAVLPPAWNGKQFGNLDVLHDIMHNFAHGYPTDGMAEKTEQLGSTFAINAMWYPQYVTSDPTLIKTMLVTDFSKFVKGSVFQEMMRSFLGTGVFNSDGDTWKFHRSMARPFFNREKISHFGVFEHHSERAIYQMKERFCAGHAVDFQDIAAKFTLDAATHFLFGKSVDFLNDPLPSAWNVQAPSTNSGLPAESPAEAFAHALGCIQEVVARRARLAWLWPLFEIFGDKCAEHMRVLDSFVNPIVQEALKKREVSHDNGKSFDEVSEGEETFIDYMARHTSEPELLHDETLNILLAARDTTASTLTFAVYFLCTHPKVFERLRAEVLSTVGPSRQPTVEDLRGMKYLRAVINETLRLYPPVPFNMRYTTCDTLLRNPDPDGKPFYAPAGTAIIFGPIIMHRSKEYWGPDAEEFDPDRFLDERVDKYLTGNPSIFLPFNAGPRICLGQQFAYNETSYFLIRLLQNFSDMQLNNAAQPPESRPPADWANAQGRKSKEQLWPKVHITLYSLGGLWVNMTGAPQESQ